MEIQNKKSQNIIQRKMSALKTGLKNLVRPKKRNNQIAPEPDVPPPEETTNNKIAQEPRTESRNEPPLSPQLPEGRYTTSEMKQRIEDKKTVDKNPLETYSFENYIKPRDKYQRAKPQKTILEDILPSQSYPPQARTKKMFKNDTHPDTIKNEEFLNNIQNDFSIKNNVLLNEIKEDETPAHLNISQSVNDIKQALQKSKKNGVPFKDNPTAVLSTQNFLTNLSEHLKNSTPKTIEKDIILLLLEDNKPTHIPRNLNAFNFNQYNDPKKLSPSDIRMLHGISKHLTQEGKIQNIPHSGNIIKTLGKILDPYPEKSSRINYIFEKASQDFKIVGSHLNQNDREKLQKALNHIGKDIALVQRYENLPLSDTHQKLLTNLKKSALKKHQAGKPLSRHEDLILTKQNPNINLKSIEATLISIYDKLQDPVYKSQRPTATVDTPLYTPRPRPN